MRTVEQRTRLLQEFVESLSLEVFKTGLEKDLSSVV